MSSNIDRIMKNAYQAIEKQPDYRIPKMEQWKKDNDPGIQKVSACKSCGTPILHKTDKKPLRCSACKKKVSDRVKERRNNGFYKKSVIAS